MVVYRMMGESQEVISRACGTKCMASAEYHVFSSIEQVLRFDFELMLLTDITEAEYN